MGSNIPVYRDSDEVKSLRRQIRQMQEALERKNREMDALHFVWCDGGCHGGTHRWTEQTITEEIVAEAERNTRRLRAWFENHKHRSASESGGRDV